MQKIKSGRVPSINAEVYIGSVGTIFYNENIGDLRLSDGVTLGGIPLALGNGTGGTYDYNQLINKPTNLSYFNNDTGYLTSVPVASNTTPGIVKVGNGLSVSGDGLISVSHDDLGLAPIALSGEYADLQHAPTNISYFNNDTGYLTSVPVASNTVLGGIKVGNGISVSGDGLISVSHDDLGLAPIALSGEYADLQHAPTNISYFNNDTGYLTSVPVASNTVLGGIKVGNGISVSGDGTISVDVSSITATPLTIKSNSTSITTQTSSINFTGDSVTTTTVGNDVTVDISGIAIGINLDGGGPGSVYGGINPIDGGYI